jgi:polygalacturonase
MSKLSLVVGAAVWLLVGGASHADPPLPVIPTNVYSILNYGGYGDGVSNNTAAISNTVKAAAATGGTVLIPANGSLSTYMAGPFNLANNINLQIDGGAMLKMFPLATFTNFPNGTAYFINANALHDVEVSGAGTIEGQGTNWWLLVGTPNEVARPIMVNINNSTRVLVQNVTLKNPPAAHIVLKSTCVSVTVRGITINTPGDSPNTDGIDLASTNCLIYTNSISCGDDNIAIGSSAGVSADILVTNCAFGAGHGVSIGSYTSSGVSDLVVSNCTFTGTGTGIRLKSMRGRGGLVRNLRYYDITMTGVEWPILMYSYYNYGAGTINPMTPYGASTNGPQPITSTTPIWRDVLVSNVTVTGTVGTRPAIYIWGLPEMPISNVTFYGVNLVGNKTANIYNGQAIRFIDSQITIPSTTNTFNLWYADITITNSGINTNLVTIGGLALPPTNNLMTFFNANIDINETNDCVAAHPRHERLERDTHRRWIARVGFDQCQHHADAASRLRRVRRLVGYHQRRHVALGPRHQRMGLCQRRLQCRHFRHYQ